VHLLVHQNALAAIVGARRRVPCSRTCSLPAIGTAFWQSTSTPGRREQWGNFVQTYSMVGLIGSAIRLSSRWDQAF